MKKKLILFFTIIFTLISFQRVNAANLLFNTSFEDTTFTYQSATEYCMNLRTSNLGGVDNGATFPGTGHLLTDEGSLIPGLSPLPHTGSRSLLLKTDASFKTVRAELELTHLDGVDPWCNTGQTLNITEDLYVSVWLYFPPNWELYYTTDGSKICEDLNANGTIDTNECLDPRAWYEMMNPFWFGVPGPRAALHIHRYEDGYYDLVLHYQENNDVVATDWICKDPLNLANIIGWHKWAYFIHRSTDPTVAYMQIYLDDVLLTNATDPNDPNFRTKTSISDGSNWWSTFAKNYQHTNRTEHYIWVDDLEVWDGIPNQEYAILSGRLVNETGSSIQATVTVGSTSSSTNSNGDYSLSVPKGIYDINYSTQNIWVKLLSFNLTTNQNNIINYISKTSSQTSFQMNITKNQMAQLYSDKRPNRVIINNTNATEVSSSSQLTNNTWFYNSTANRLYILVSLTKPIQTCSDNTPYGQCSSTKPLYCDNGNLIDKCTQCGCSSGQCNTTTEKCYTSYNYTIYKSGTNTCMNDKNGNLVLCDANTSYVINRVITDTSSVGGGSILVENGDYSLSSSISMKSNVAVYLQLDVTFTATYAPTSRQGIVDFRGVTNAHFLTETEPADESKYPKIIGIGTSNNEAGVLMTYGGSTSTRTTNSSVGKIAFSNIGGYGICLRYADYNIINGTYVKGFTKTDGNDHQGLTIRVGSYNKLINCHIDAEFGQYANHPLYFGGEGPVTYNEVIGGIYENSAITHAIYWCSETNASLPDSSHYGWFVDHNKAIDGISRGCRGSGYSAGFKLNAATNSTINWTIIDSSLGLAMGDGNKDAGGNHGNVVYVAIRNCRKGADFSTQSDNMHTQNNEVHIDFDGDNPNYPATGEVGYVALDFAGWANPGITSFVQYNDIYLRARNVRNGVYFASWGTGDPPGYMTETQEARYNTLNLDVEASQRAIVWTEDCRGYGRYNTFNGYWHSTLAGNCGSVPNASYVYSALSPIPNCSVVATNTFNSGSS